MPAIVCLVRNNMCLPGQLCVLAQLRFCAAARRIKKKTCRKKRTGSLRQVFYVAVLMRTGFYCIQFFQIVRCFLIDNIQPIMIEQVSITAPRKNRCIRIVVFWIVMLGNRNGKPFFLVTQIFCFQRSPVIFKVTENKETAMIFGADNINPIFRGP